MCIPRDYQQRTPVSSLQRSWSQLLLNLIKHVFWKQLYLPAKMLTTGAHVLFCPDPVGPLWTQGKVVVTVHDLIFFRYPKEVNRWWGLYWRTVLPLCLRRADSIIAISEATKQQLNSILGIRQEKVTVAYDGYDSQLFYRIADIEALRFVHAKYKLPERFILFVGSIERRRNIETLLRAVAYLRDKQGLTLPIVIAGGRTNHASHLESVILEQGLQDQVVWLGYVPDEDLPLLYNVATMYVYPSIAEGFGLTMLEAMACGCPVICSNVDSLPEVAGEACILLSPTDTEGFAGAIRRVWMDTTLAQTMREKGLAQAQRFSWENMAEIVAHVCEEI